MFYDPRNGPDPSPEPRISLVLIVLVSLLAAGLVLVTTGLQ